MKVYLVEVVIGKRLEAISIQTNWEKALGLITSAQVGTITEMIIDEGYPEGIGICEHWHFDPNELDIRARDLMGEMNTRITLEMTAKDVIVAMGGGVPGALTVCMSIMEEGSKIDPQNLMGGLGALLNMDTLGVYEHRIWMFYKDVCGENLEKMLGMLRANQLGFVSAEILNNAIDNRGQGIDVNDLFDKVKERLPEFGGV